MDLTVVVPCFNEIEALGELHRQLTFVLREGGLEFEILFIDDGSTDGSGEMLNELCSRDPQVGLITFRRNFGKAAALDAGFRRARGDVVVTLDADLQDQPTEIPRLLQKLGEGVDLVTGWKRDRKDPLSKTIPSSIFNATVRLVSRLPLHDLNSGLKAYRAVVVENLHLYGEMHRFIPVLAHWQGFSVAEIPVEHRERPYGRSKYGLARLGKGFFDLLTVMLNTRFQARPLHLFGWIGSAIGAVGSLILVYLVILWFLGRGPIGNRPLLLFGALMVMVGIQLVSTGLLGELITREQQAEKPTYVIRSFVRPGVRQQQPSKVPDKEPGNEVDHRPVSF